MPINVPITRTVFDALRERARQERRSPREQAAVIIEEALKEKAGQGKAARSAGAGQ
jgi:hypothetical protein